MEFPIFHNRKWLFGYLLVWAIISVNIAFAITSFSLMPFAPSLVYGLVSGYGFAALAIPLWNVLKYTDYSIRKFWQVVVNYIALGVLVVAVWILGQYLLFDYFFESNILAFQILLPFLFLLGACFFVIIVLVYEKWLAFEEKIDAENVLENTDNDMINCLKEGQEKLEEAEEMLERIAVKTKQNIEMVQVSDILFIQSEGDYVMIHTATKRLMKEQTMKFLERHLPANQFVRVHRSTIVNVSSISKIELFEKQSYLVVLKNGARIKASLAGYKLLKSVLNL